MKPRFRVIPASHVHNGMTLLVKTKKITKQGVVEYHNKTLPVTKVIRHGIGDGTVIHCWDNDIHGPRVLAMLNGDTVLVKCVQDVWGDWVIGYPWVITKSSWYYRTKVDGFDVTFLDDKPQPVRGSVSAAEMEQRMIDSARRLLDLP